MAGLRGLAAAGLIQRSNPADGPAGIELHPFISEVTRSVMASSDPAQTGIDPQTVRECAIAVIEAALSRLDPGSAEHWPYFSVLTPHVTGLLTDAAPHLSMKHRRTLLNGMVRCIASYMWSRAESRAQQLAVDALALARGLKADHEPVYQRLRHMRAWSLREQGRFSEAEALFREVLAELMRMPGGAMRGTPCARGTTWRGPSAARATGQTPRNSSVTCSSAAVNDASGGAATGMTRISCTLAACCAGPSASKDGGPKLNVTTGSSRRTAPDYSGPTTRTPWTPGKTSAKPWPGKTNGPKPSAN